MSPEAVPPGNMAGTPGWLLGIIRDQRVAFLIVGAVNTLVGFVCFAGFLLLLGQHLYVASLLCAYVVSVLIAFVLYRYVVFRVRGHVLADLWRFSTVYLAALGLNLVVLPGLVEIVHLPALVSQALFTFVTATISWVGHKHYSFRRSPSSDQVSG